MRVATHLFPYCYWYLLVLVHVLCQSLWYNRGQAVGWLQLQLSWWLQDTGFGNLKRSSRCTKDLFGDSRWMPLPRPKVHSAQVYPQYPQYPGYGGYGGYSGYPGYMGYPGYHGYPGYSMGPAIGGVMGPAMPPGTEPEQIDPSDRAMALRMLAAALGSRVTDDMLADVPKATFAEAARLLLAVLGFMCEGQFRLSQMWQAGCVAERAARQ